MSSLRPALGARSWLMNSRILACGTGLAPTLRVTGLAGSRVWASELGAEEPPHAVSARAVTMPVARRVSDLRIGCVPFEIAWIPAAWPGIRFRCSERLLAA